MYTDTRVRTGKGYYTTYYATITYFWDDPSGLGPVRSLTNVYASAGNRENLNQSITSVRGPKPTGRRIVCNPMLAQKTIVTAPKPVQQFVLRSPLVKFGTGTTAYYKAYVVWGDAIMWTVAQDSYLYGISTALPSIQTKDRNYCLQKCYAKANDSLATVYVTLGELTETLAMLRNPLASLRKFLKVIYKKKNANTMGDLGKFWKDQWLEYRYGIMPLIFEIQGIRNAFETKSGRIFQSKASVRRNLGTTTSFYNHSDVGLDIQVKYERTLITKVSTGLYFNPIPIDRFGANVTQLLPAIWELVPGSFIVNWLVDVDTWINGLMAATRVHPFAGFVTTKQSVVIKGSVVKITGRYANCAIDPSWEIIRRVDKVQRTTDLSVDLSTVHFNNAYTGSWRRIIDSVALLWQTPGKIIKSLK